MNRILFILIFTSLSSYCQSPGGLIKPSLWIEGATDLKNKKQDTSAYFNFNPKYNALKTENKQHKNILGNQYSLFMAFQSSEKEEMPIAKLQIGNETTTITNRKVENDKSLEYKKVDTKDGMVLSYLVSKQHQAKKKTNIFYLENIKNKANQSGHNLLELVYYPRVLNTLEKRKVETYLSIKYGISLINGSDYFDSGNNKLWDAENNSSYSMRVTGIGRDDDSGLNQKQSGNSEKDGLYIGFNAIKVSNELNESMVANKTFMVWGDNGGSISLKKDKNEKGMSQMKRIWKMQYSGIQSDSVLTTVRIDKKEMQFQEPEMLRKGESIWLAVNQNALAKFDYTSASYFLQSEENDTFISFKNVTWDSDKSGSDLFTFIKAPSFFTTYDITGPNCALSQNAKIKLKAVGGQAPYFIKLNSDSYSKGITTDEDTVELPDLPAGTYQVTIVDGKSRTQSDMLTISPITETELTIASEWYLDENGEAMLFPNSEIASKFEYEWYMNDLLLSKGEKFTAKEPGNYSLLAKNAQGCSKEFLLKVNGKQDASSNVWLLYPNPVETDQNFTLHFDLKESADAEIAIYELGGKLLRTKNLYSIKNFDYKDSLGFSGTYLILVTLQGKSKAIKLIVR